MDNIDDWFGPFDASKLLALGWVNLVGSLEPEIEQQ